MRCRIFLSIVIGIMGFAGKVDAASFCFNQDLTIGSRGEQVTALQTILEEKNFLKIPEGMIKGYFGNLTSRALAKYQTDLGIEFSTGFFGPITREKLNDKFCKNQVDDGLNNLPLTNDLEVLQDFDIDPQHLAEVPSKGIYRLGLEIVASDKDVYLSTDTDDFVLYANNQEIENFPITVSHSLSFNKRGIVRGKDYRIVKGNSIKIIIRSSVLNTDRNNSQELNFCLKGISYHTDPNATSSLHKIDKNICTDFLTLKSHTGPLITSISPDSGMRLSTSQIKGSGFTKDSRVYFDNSRVKSEFVDSETINFRVPYFILSGRKYVYVKSPSDRSQNLVYNVLTLSGESSQGSGGQSSSNNSSYDYGGSSGYDYGGSSGYNYGGSSGYDYGGSSGYNYGGSSGYDYGGSSGYNYGGSSGYDYGGSSNYNYSNSGSGAVNYQSSIFDQFAAIFSAYIDFILNLIR